MSWEEKIVALLKIQNQTLAVAESCSGGLLSHRLTNIPGSSAFFVGGVIAYDNSVKIKFLKIPPQTLHQHGAVSAEVALAMAKNVRKLFRTDLGLGITGIAGPGGGTARKPVGLVYIAVADVQQALVIHKIFTGNRRAIKKHAATAALKLLIPSLTG